jgi:OOP family OmpA-OmpF porin
MPRLTPFLASLAAFAVAALLAAGAATVAATSIEDRTRSSIEARLAEAGVSWVTVETDGLQVRLSGTAPDEAARFRAVNLAGAEIEPSRIRDDLEVAAAKAIEAPTFSVEILRNDSEIQLIGLIPAETDREALADSITAIAGTGTVTDMLETADFPEPEGWDAALDFALAALKDLPRSKISVAPKHVEVTAIADSEAQKTALEARIGGAVPEGLTTEVAISAPRPVLTPFTLRFVIDGAGARFDACSADTEQARARILAAAAAAGMTGPGTCDIGLGTPSTKWAAAVEAGIAALAQLGQGALTFSDADVTLAAAQGTDQALYDRVIGELEAALPDAFSLKAELPKAEAAVPAGPAEVTATLAAETHRLEIRGRLNDELLRGAVNSYARAEFGIGNVYLATRIDPELPKGWPVRVLAGLKALAQLDHGTLTVRPDTVIVTGVSGSQMAKARIAQILSSSLGQGQTFTVNVTYDEELDPLAALPTPEECAQDIDAALARQKITFEPGSAEIAGAAAPLMDELAKILKDCPGIRMEVAGHTDAQGSESGNLALSQARAEAVVVALQGRQVNVSGLKAVGYGESRPIADNQVETGREANRRIEFTLVVEAPATAAASANAEGVDGPDFSGDMSPSVAPTEKTRRPKSRPGDFQ